MIEYMEKENNKKETTIDDLAILIQKGLLELKSEIAEVKKELKSDISELKLDINEIKLDTQEIKTNLNKKVDKIDHNTLTYRVEKLEKNFA
ncbi:MAG: hypothetical protein UR66_C0007G0052 [Candidatus Moranbacteria bacterium GW2011_GWE1_35_17]|nr:MAG: hypothetical protein UR66_C0007G0052 [Candidatus Moranbacteria bacterium GW2011_GWE1_35_17]KKP71804.1 MAG: hypothetical protein UR65_C0026G0015 [Candidatus Moranbacteria bacterium GW2011_GWE2_35_164]KKP82849.1 MAG: hypothetical protein UR82_C0029G0003 [Candidatus Moranbacteria bacterium GW2011_GWF1_35_5]KKP84527.1 MAG: hypothetical protein UR83_C0019G0020 [Candidatus Moranbacteria bacterium GW2011_GWF2_35_54]